MAIEDILGRSEIFLGLDDSYLKMIASMPSAKQMNFQTGQVLFKAGDAAENLYILEEGQINLIVEIPECSDNKLTQITVDIANKGSLIGWSALVRPHLYVLSAVCRKPCKVAAISGHELLTLFEQNHSIGYKVFQGLSQVIGTRFRDLQQILITGKRWPFIEKHAGT
jgi:CRP/FNR family cyclic AMP-dependent transcriptional regulator